MLLCEVQALVKCSLREQAIGFKESTMRQTKQSYPFCLQKRLHDKHKIDAGGIEPPTPATSTRCSPTELRIYERLYYYLPKSNLSIIFCKDNLNILPNTVGITLTY